MKKQDPSNPFFTFRNLKWFYLFEEKIWPRNINDSLIFKAWFYLFNDTDDLKIVIKMRWEWDESNKKEFIFDIPETRKLVICVSSVTE